METKTDLIKKLLDKAYKKSGADMVSLVNAIGNGNMQSGFKMLQDYFTGEGFEKGQKHGAKFGFTSGIAITSIVFGSILVIKEAKKRNTARKQHEATGEEIIERLEKYVIRNPKIVNSDIPLKHTCSKCGIVANSLDEISSIFGYKENEGKELVPEDFCKRCREV